ncbi:hypothetical protein HDU79_003283 [Rhizoclosmatium sp. JEL0117]|nr:hypothetical protein HDU79_003283 [Rhizoclosmatium sp. JEL0117]
MDLARKHLEIGASSLTLSSDDLDPQQSGGEGVDEKKYSKLRIENIAKKDRDVQGLMLSLQALSEDMSRVHFDQTSAVTDDTTKLFGAS